MLIPSLPIVQDGIVDGSFVFFCINTTSHAAWGTLPSLMATLLKNELTVIDHRSWHSRFESTVINEMYVKGTAVGSVDICEYIEQLEHAIKDTINQEVCSLVPLESDLQFLFNIF